MKRGIALLFVLLALALPAHATWSIVVVNTRTGEVAVASATCIGSRLKRWVGVVAVGKGAGAAQAFVPAAILTRKTIYDGLVLDTAPADILATLEAIDSGHSARQYGIVGFGGLPVTFSGDDVEDAKPNVVGAFGDYLYAIQGNVLAGDRVALDAELALRTAPGDLGQKIMAGMEAARAAGGDGRCSCDPFDPPGCGSPPPSFDKTATVAFIVVARMGDTDGACTSAVGCADGDYYLDIEVTDSGVFPDPVQNLALEYDAWRAALVGRPDHLKSTVSPGATRLPADGVSTTDVTVRLVDVEGQPLITGGATVSVSTADGQPALATPGAVTDNGDGTYTFPLTAGTTAGTDTFVLVADDGVSPVTLWPYLEIEVAAVQPLTVGLDQVSALAGGEVPFVLNVPSAPLGGYVLLGSASGTFPGVPVGSVLLPLNPDNFFQATVNQAGTAVLPGSVGLFDPNGRGTASFAPPPGLLANFIGRRFDWAALHLSASLGVTNAVGFDVVD